LRETDSLRRPFVSERRLFSRQFVGHQLWQISSRDCWGISDDRRVTTSATKNIRTALPGIKNMLEEELPIVFIELRMQARNQAAANSSKPTHLRESWHKCH
jgi:hypothetical protein